tara:strand:- start:2374 stop:3819 length:1446 start_codon:yes stop_codon:yes gene_type:complete
MAIIYTYPRKTDPSSQDTLLISDVEDGNKTKQVSIKDIRSATVSGVSSIIADTPNVTLSPAAGTGDVGISVTGWTRINGVLSNGLPSGNIIASASEVANFAVKADTNMEIQGDNASTLTFSLEEPTGNKKGGITALIGPTNVPSAAVQGDWYPVNNVETDPTRLAVRIPSTGGGSMNDFLLQADTPNTPSTITDGDLTFYRGGTGIQTELVTQNNISLMDISLEQISGLIPGNYTSTNLTVDATGRIIAASNGSGSGSSNGELLYTSVFQADTNGIDQNNPPAYALTKVSGPATPFGQVAFNKDISGVPQGPPNRECYAIIPRPANTIDFIRVVATLFVDFHDTPDSFSEQYNMYFGLHNDSQPTTPGNMQYGWVQKTFTNIDVESNTDNFLHIHEIYWDIQVSDLRRFDGNSPIAGQNVPLFLKAAYESTSNVQPLIRFGNWYQANLSTGAYTNRFAAGPSKMDVYLLNKSKYAVNPQLA